MKPLLAALIVALGLASPTSAQVADHLKCYKIKDPQAKAKYTADLGGLVAEPGCTITVPGQLFCTQTTKTNVIPPPPGGADNTGSAGRFLCYKVKCPRATLPTVPWHDQFGTRTLVAKTASLVCAPEILPTTTTTTTSTSSSTTTTSTTTPFPPCATFGAACGTCGSGTCLPLCDHGCALVCLDTSDNVLGCSSDAQCPPTSPYCAPQDIACDADPCLDTALTVCGRLCP